MTTAIFHEQLNTILAQNPDALVTKHIEKMAGISKPLILFGAGQLGKIALIGLRKANIEPIAFADNSARLWGSHIEGVPIFSPADAVKKFGKESIFVISVYTNSAVRQQLKEIGGKFITFAELAWYYHQVFIPHYAIDLPYVIFQESKLVQQALDIWTDDTSKNEYLAQLKWRTSLDASALPLYNKPEEMYFPTDLFSLLPDDTLVDCGAYDGDTIRELEKKNIQYGQIIAIEPDPINYENLKKYIASLPTELRKKISAQQNAVGAFKHQLSFDATGTANTIVQTGSSSIEVIPLDELLANQKPTYIKMDIEGAEYEALLGCKKTIEQHRPILAICLYHKQQDLWRIPILIHSISNQYSFFLRRYSDECWEQVCYAIPNERIQS